ncbi:solute carrier family 43 member 3a isoform X1 [Syngnathus typhle]|uniref:solute carrier family 43 member 3a isoform X1 n=2 Tax=Syngnathus typhle TaxID=161592 RepID=UPI002A6A4DE5|nr:solute carrier family 43 member 3a isoform X1 [Syngnathus typhle]
MHSHKMGMRLRYRLTFLSGVLECLCFAGVVFGYASLVFVLKKDGYFSQLCVSAPDSNVTTAIKDCSSQDEKFALVFTIASFLNNFMNLFSGFIFDRFGTMITRLLAISLYTTGTLLVTFANSTLSILLYPALSCIAVGGILLLMTNMQVGNLFPAHRSTIITLYNGAYDSSSAVFLVMKVLHEQGISLRSSFLFLSLCSILHVVRTITLMPKTHIPYPVPQGYTYGLKCGKGNSYNVEEKMRDEALAVSTKSSCRMNTSEDETELSRSGKDLVPSFRSCVLSWFFMCHVMWLSIMQLRHYLFIGTLNSMLSHLAKNDANLVSQYTNAFAMTQLFGVLCAPWNGLILDRHKGKPLGPGVTEKEADLRSASGSLFLTSLQCLLFSLCASIPSLPLQYFTFVLQVINRSFIYGGNAVFISIVFPACHFGKLYGLVLSLSAVFSLLQYPCFALVKGPLGGDPFYVDIALTLITLLVFIHPLYVFIHCHKSAGLRRNRQTVTYNAKVPNVSE